MNLDYNRGLTLLAQAVREVNGMGGKTLLMLDLANHCYRLNNNQRDIISYFSGMKAPTRVLLPRGCGKSAFTADFAELELRVLSHFDILADCKLAYETLMRRSDNEHQQWWMGS